MSIVFDIIFIKSRGGQQFFAIKCINNCLIIEVNILPKGSERMSKHYREAWLRARLDHEIFRKCMHASDLT